MKTGVEYIVQEIKRCDAITMVTVEYALELEKEMVVKVVTDFGFSKEKAEQYYNETFNNKNNETRKRSWVL
jgi:hypothetical protein